MSMIYRPTRSVCITVINTSVYSDMSEKPRVQALAGVTASDLPVRSFSGTDGIFPNAKLRELRKRRLKAVLISGVVKGGA